MDDESLRIVEENIQKFSSRASDLKSNVYDDLQELLNVAKIGEFNEEQNKQIRDLDRLVQENEALQNSIDYYTRLGRRIFEINSDLKSVLTDLELEKLNSLVKKNTISRVTKLKKLRYQYQFELTQAMQEFDTATRNIENGIYPSGARGRGENRNVSILNEIKLLQLDRTQLNPNNLSIKLPSIKPLNEEKKIVKLNGDVDMGESKDYSSDDDDPSDPSSGSNLEVISPTSGLQNTSNLNAGNFFSTFNPDDSNDGFPRQMDLGPELNKRRKSMTS